MVSAMSGHPYAAAVVGRVEEAGNSHDVTIRQWAASERGRAAYSYEIRGLSTSEPLEPVFYHSPEEAWQAAMAVIVPSR